MTEINNSSFFVRVLTDTSVELYTDNDLRLTANTQGYSSFTSGGSIEHKGGPDIITINGSASNPIDIDNDIIGKTSYTDPNSSTKFANGQVIKFNGDYVIPQNKIDIEYIVEGVGDSIQLVKKNLNFGNLFNPNLTTKNYYTIGRGAGNENIWSRLNFWYHESLYTSNAPVSSARAVRPILEYDKNLEMYNHGTTSRGNVDINAGNLKFENVNGSPEEQSIDGVNLTNGTTIIFPKDNIDIAKHVYNVSISANVINLSVATDPVTSANFTLASNDTVTVVSGTAHKGKDFYLTSTELTEAQNKSTANQAPLFKLYNDELKYLGNESLYPLNNFTGSKIFAHKLGTGTNDAEYGFPISFKPFKSSSEVEYENFIDTVRYSYTAIGSTTETNQNGYYYYKILKSTPEYHTYLKNASNKNKQRIITKFELSIFDIDESKTKFYIGCIPNVDTNNTSGYDIEVLVNGKKREDFTYSDTGYITFTSFNFVVNDLIDISVLSDSGLLSNDSISKYELPLSWRGNPFNNDVTTIAEPEYLPHFKSYIQDQKNFTGNVLSSNNFANLEKDPSKADQIIQATQDTILGAFLLDDQEHNLVDALRFNNREFTRYKRRFRKELTNYFNVTDVTELSNEFILEKVLRSLISYSVGKKVFNQTYILPFGDNYTEEKFSISSLDQVSFTLTNYADLDKIENSLLIYLDDSNNNRTLLEVDTDYTITSFNPITVTLSATSGYAIGNTIISKLYNQDRDSAQCPPTPSTMGLYPLYTPTIEVDGSFQTDQSLLVGHDGSKTSLYNDRRDNILLEFEKRIYNSAKAEFRENNSLADLNVAVVKPGAFRNTFYSQNDWNDLLNLNYANWVSSNNLDAVTNEFFDADDSWTWNYRGDSDLPGHWRGWYEYYYDTVRPHTHPWEMLGFTEIPSWWINQYGSDYSLSNTSLWHDLEHGIIRRGTRENFTNLLYLESNFNPFRRKGLKNYYPIDSNGALRSPYDITSTQTTTRTVSYTNASGDALADPEYNNGAIIDVTGDGSDFFKREVTTNGVRIMGAGTVGGQTAVPDAWLEKVARMVELFTDPNGAGINGTAQRELIKNLSGDAGTYHAGLPTLQRVARGSGADYTPNFLTDPGIISWNLTNLYDTHVHNDMVWYLNSTGSGYGDGDTDAQEVIEHVFHTLHMHGLDAQTLKLYQQISADWNTGPLYNAMVEAYDGGFWDPSGYESSPGAFKTNSEAFEVAAKEYLFLLNFCMFDYSSLWDGGSLAPEWSDSMRTPAGIQANNPLGYALHNTYIAPVISKPSLSTIRNIFQNGNTPAQDNPALAGVSGYVVDASSSPGYVTTSFLETDGSNVNFDAYNVYITSNNISNYATNKIDTSSDLYPIAQKELTYNVVRADLTTGVAANSTVLPSNAIGVLTNGLPLYNPKSSTSYNDEDVWHYDIGYQNKSNRAAGIISSTNADGIIVSHVITEDMSNTTAWGNSTTHSGIVGWAFDGLPIYGPYGYTDPSNTSSGITNIKSAFVLKSTNRASGPGGKHTGVFVEDYELGSGNVADGYADKWNHRTGLTPDSPNVQIDYYVVTIDDDGEPMFPYAVGGGTEVFESSNLSFASTYFKIAYDVTNNSNNQGYTDPTSEVAISSTEVITKTFTPARNSTWRIGDGASVENAWKYSEEYPFAVTEGLLLARPGLFATLFSDPIKLYNPTANKKQYLSTVTRRKWDFRDTNDFAIHGDINDNGEMITNIGYTQFINSWLKFQGLDVNNFADKLRTVNLKLGHRLAGYVDKDTMILSLDQYSTTGSSTNLIIPEENITVNVHKSPFKARNSYSGVIIEKSTNGYKIRGYDKTTGYFEYLPGDTRYERQNVSAGGTPVDYISYTDNTSYDEQVYVEYNDTFYVSKSTVPSSENFNPIYWTSLSALPLENAATGVYYQRDTGVITRAYYETEYSDIQDVFDILAGIGRYQTSLGFDFGEYDADIGDVRNWVYSAKQFLFWTTGSWQIGNTIELSPLATKVMFEAPLGFVAQINKIDRNQFSIMDRQGVAIDPKACDIIRENNILTVSPPADVEIYSITLYTAEIEHAMVLDNTTVFADTIYDPFVNQKQNRIKIKATKTANWNGRFLSEGFIIDGDELKPNLDNLAETMGKYHEVGFVPVEKQVYETARSLYGYKERDFLNELDITDDQQFEFYRGMIQNKGTNTSLSRIGRSSSIVQGEMQVYDEWAIKVGDFGDLNNDQTVELKLEKKDVVQDPQLITLSFPEDTTGIIDRIDVLSNTTVYYETPNINISAPSSGTQATGTVLLNSDKKLSSINLINQGTGYATAPSVKLEASNTSIILKGNTATSSSAITTVNEYGIVDGNITYDYIWPAGVYVDTTTATPSNANSSTQIVSISANSSLRLANVQFTSDNSAIDSIYYNANTSAVSFTEGFFNQYGSSVGVAVVRVDPTISANTTNLSGLSNLIITDNLSGDSATIDLSSISDVNDIVTAINTNGNINASVSANEITSTINLNPSANVQYDANTKAYTGEPSNVSIVSTLSISGSDFTLADDDSNITLGKLLLSSGRYQPRRRYGFIVADNINDTTLSNLDYANVMQVSIEGTAIDSTKYTLDPGDRWSITNTSGKLTSGSIAFDLDTGIVNSSNTFVTENIANIEGIYEFIDVYVDNVKLENNVDVRVFEVPNVSAISFPDVSKLPNEGLETTSVISIVEKATIDLDATTVTNDIPGNTLRIIAYTEDDLSLKLGLQRSYDITPDASDDEIILIDIDDTNRFLKKPLGVRDYKLWANTSNVTSYGITDSKFNPLPNSGYINSNNVDFQAFDVPSISNLFDGDVIYKPETNDLIHVAKSENDDWNVYKLSKANTTLSFIEQAGGDATTYLYSKGKSLFDYLDANLIGGNDNGRYLDYHLVVKDTDLVDQFVIWTNEEVVDRKHVSISDFGGVNMLEANISSLGPITSANANSTYSNSIYGISSFSPASSGYTSASAILIGNNTVQINSQTYNLEDGDTVEFYAVDNTDTLYSTSNIQYVHANVTTSVSSSSNVITFPSPPAGVDADNLIYFSTYNNDVGAPIDLHSEEVSLYLADANSTLSYVNESNVVIPSGALPLLGATANSVTLSTIVNNQIKITVNTTGIEEGDTIRLVASNVEFHDSTWAVSNVNSSSNYIIIESDDWIDQSDNLGIVDKDTIGLTGFNLQDVSNLHANSYTVSNVGLTSFTIEDANISANVDSSNLTFSYFGKTQISTTADHNITSGEFVKVIGGTYSGYHYAETVSANTFVINVPYNANATANTSISNVITQGIQITTTSDHGISGKYVGKRIAVHMAEPRYYNQVFTVSDVPSSNTIIITQGFSYADVANAQSNGAVLTTLDHNKVRMNNADIVVDNINNERAVVSSFNRALDLRRGFIDDENGEFSMSIPMFTSIDKSFKNNNVDPLMTAGGMPYVTQLKNVAGLTQVGVMPIDPMVELPRGFAKDGFITGQKINPATIGDADYDLNPSRIPYSKINSGPFTPKIIGNSLYDPTGSLQSVNFGQAGNGVDFLTSDNAKPLRVPLWNIDKNAVTKPAGLGTAHIGKPIIDPSKAIVQAKKKTCGPEACITQPVPKKPINVPTTKFERTNYGGTVTASNVSGVGKGARRWGSQYSGYYVNTGKSSGQASRNGGTSGKFGIQPRGLFGAVAWYDNGSRSSVSASLTFSVAGTFYLHAYQAGKGNFSTTYVQINGVQTRGTYVGKGGTYNSTGAVYEFTADAGQTITISAVGKGGGNHWGSIAFHISARKDTLTIEGPYRQVTVGGEPTTSNATKSNNLHGKPDLEFCQQTTRSRGVNDDWFFAPAGSGQVDLIFDNFSGADGYQIFQGTSRGQENTLVYSSLPDKIVKASSDEKQQLLLQASSLYKTVNGQTNKYSSQQTIKDFIIAPKNSQGLGVRYGGKLSWYHDSSKGAYIKVRVLKQSSVYRFLIKLPKVAPPIDNPNPGTGCTQVTVYQPGVATPTGGSQSPIYQPTGNPQTTKKGGGSGGYMSVGGVGGGGGGGSYKSAGIMDYKYRYQMNFGGFGTPAMAGYSYVPTVFKKTIKVASTPNFGSFQQLDDSIYVNSTTQRVTGGITLPLAKPLSRKAQIGPKALRSVDLSTFPIFDELIGNNSGNFYRNNNTVTYRPRKIGSTIKLSDGTIISNVLNTIDLQDVIGGDNIVISFPSSGVNVFRPISRNTVDMQPPLTVPSNDAPIETSNVDFADTPEIAITPLLRDEFGALLPAGDTAVAVLNSPTPGYTMSIPDMIGIEPGSELLINGSSIVFPGSDPAIIENALKCSDNNGFTVTPTTKDKTNAVRISSCSGAPLTIRDGCAGGVYKEVLDFHVVRGFEQTISDTSNTVTLPTSTGYQTGNTSSVAPDAVYTLYDVEGTATQQIGGSGVIDTETGAVLSSRTTTTTTGGSGYSVGDRLRVVGGVPVADPYGPITEICIDNPGSGYTSEANVKVYIGNGVTPGTGALTGSVMLNQTGGIHKVLLLSGGSGYDMARPPEVRIVDLGQGTSIIPATPAKAHAKVGSGASLPPRVSKFVVTSIDPNGTITSLQVIDRGIYKQFPSDLTQGVPLEYDIIGLGDETGYDDAGTYFQGTGLGQYDPMNNNASLDSPGGYDPIRGTTGGGKGARVFLTAREIPDCSERGDAKSRLGLPDIVSDISIPDDMAANLNDALRRAGYDPDDIYFDTDRINDDITNLVLRSPGYDGVDIDEFTPGFLDKLGIPKGTYDPDMLCMVASLSTSNTEPTRQTRTNDNTLANDQGYSTLMPIDIPRIQITCVDRLGWDRYNNGFGNGIDDNSLFGDGNVSFTTDMYQYELRKLDGTPVNTASGQQECSVHYLESMRFANISQLNSFDRPDGNLTLSNYSNVWIDSDSNTQGKTNFITDGWSYYENGTPNKWQTPMVDTEFVKNVILYDKESGTKEVDFHFWDPFKGVIPGFLDREITYKSNQDPVVYNSARSVFGEKHVGQVWWDTSTIAYQWYEQGLDEFGNPNNRERWLNWGKAFPGSAVTLYEWVESRELPLNYSGTGTPRNGSDYIVRKVLNEKVGTYQNYYYFWVQNKEDLSNEVKTSLGRNWNTLTLAKYIADPVRYGLPMVSFVSDQSFVLTNLSQNIREDEQILQINLSRNLNPIGEKHTAWKLMRESDNNSIVPDDLGNKLIDSLTGENAIGQSVPDPLLSEVEAYGIKFRPRQSMFKNVKNARRVLFYTLNEILAETKLQTNYPNWDADLPNVKTYIETTNWFAVQRINNSDNSKIRYDNTFKPIFSVGSVQELDSLNNLPDDTIVQVQAKESDRYQLWEYTGSSNSFDLIAIENDTIRLKDTVYTDDTNATLSLELRKLLVALRDTVFAGTNLWNKLFFALLRYSYIEQEQLDWAFKSTYIYIEKDEEDLIEVNGFKIDNFDKVLQYFDEVKPYTAKVRQYKDGKSPPKEFISGNSVSDFDKPPYADPITGNIRILNDSVADDVAILSTNNTYVKYYSISNKSQDPIRRFKSTIKFDRTSYELYPMDFQAGVGNVVDLSLTTSNNNVIENTTSSTAIIERGNVAIARNIVNLMGMSNAELHANVYTRAIDRIFKLDTTVISSFTTQLNEHFGVTDAYSNANIINSTANITAVIDAGNLTTTFDILKTKAGGDFQGEVIDANVFTKYAEGIPDSEVAQVFGFASQPLDSIKFDEGIAIDNYEGVFTGTPTLVRDSLPYDGFDGVTFQRVLYGEERPQELALVDPFESVLITVTTNANLQGNANLSSASSNASTVKYQIHSDIFGNTEYLRLLEDGSTSSLLTANLTVTDGTVSVANASVFTPPKSGVPGVVWVGDERIEFTRYHNGDASSNVLTGITRGTKGTAIQNWYSSDNIRVFNGSQNENFTDAVLNVPGSTYDVDSNIWLDSGSTSLADKGNASSNANSIMKFLHNL